MAIRISRTTTEIHVGPGLDLVVTEIPAGGRPGLARDTIEFHLVTADGTSIEVTKHSLKFATAAVAEFSGGSD